MYLDCHNRLVARLDGVARDEADDTHGEDDMIKIGTMACAAVGALAIMAGCSSSSSDSGGGGGAAAGAPDFSVIETKLTKPTGTFDTTQTAVVTDSFGTQMSAAESNPFGGSGSTTTTKSFGGELAFQTVHPNSLSASCPGLQSGGAGSCPCDSGSISYSLPPGGFASDPSKVAGPINVSIDLTASACADTGSVYDGGIHIKEKSLLADHSDLFLLYDIHLTVTGAKPGKYDIDYLLKNGVITFAVAVKDGTVLIAAKGSWDKSTKTGSFTITDKDGTWTCTAVSGKGSCTDKGGVVHNFG
jgi:hypothetical protein